MATRPEHSLHTGPGVVQLRDVAALTTGSVWITATIPGDFAGAEADPTPGEDVVTQWTSMVAGPEEVTWPREMLAVNATGNDAEE